MRNAFGGGNAGWNSGNMFDRMQKKAPAQQPSQQTAQKPAPKPNFTGATSHVPSTNFVPDDPAGMEPGMQVEHQKFGFGEVIKMEGSAHNPIATVKFEHNGEKKIMLNYAKLRIVEK